MRPARGPLALWAPPGSGAAAAAGLPERPLVSLGPRRTPLSLSLAAATSSLSLSEVSGTPRPRAGGGGPSKALSSMDFLCSLPSVLTEAPQLGPLSVVLPVPLLSSLHHHPLRHLGLSCPRRKVPFSAAPRSPAQQQPVGSPHPGCHLPGPELQGAGSCPVSEHPPAALPLNPPGLPAARGMGSPSSWESIRGAPAPWARGGHFAQRDAVKAPRGARGGPACDVGLSGWTSQV